MKKLRNGFLLSCCLLLGMLVYGQETSQVYKWTVGSKKIAGDQYELSFSTDGNKQWQLYAPGQSLDSVAAAELQFPDSVIKIQLPFKDSGTAATIHSSIFNIPVKIFNGPTTWKVAVHIQGKIPAVLQGTLMYTYGKGEEFYPSTLFVFSVPLEGGVASGTRIKISSIDINNPVNSCGDNNTVGKSLWAIFILGFIGGLIALITPCVFPLIPLTVSFFTKKSGTRTRGIRNAFFYGLSIFLIYAFLSLPFHLINKLNPEVLNNISTNVWLNLVFFIVFIFFAFSYFGFYEIGLPPYLAGKIDSKAGIGDFWGIFFMALTLAIVSFSCTGPILGSLLAGALTGNNGATQLTFGMSGFGLGLALPFALFALFPNWLQNLPKSGGWLNSVKVVLGFLELAMAVKFLSNADLVEQWGLLKREIFIAIWILTGICITAYLIGIIRFGHDSKPVLSKARMLFILIFGAFTLYLLPGVTNTKYAKLSLISGFPPPFSYSIYKHPVNYESGVEPLRDYEQALALARKENKPLLVDFTGWACVNCRRMEENVWVDEQVKNMMKNDFIVVSLFVDERKKLPVTDRIDFITKNGSSKQIITIGDKWATFQSENFNSVSQPQYAILSSDEKALTRTKGYTPTPSVFADWLKCGLEAHKAKNKVSINN
ncbi:MAG TPA: cytochrome c biogenesis protein CcdA [Flavisolibacter sp.]|nr:cytochrome c biogenesis protein CcdA [Flavisolibacter sp.]